MVNHTKGSTSSTVLIILLVIIVGFVVWYVTAKNNADTNEPAVQLNLGDNSGQE